MTSPKTSNPIKTILTICIGLIVVYLFTELKWTLITAASVGTLGLLSDKIARFIDFLWMKLAWILGLIVPNILLSIFFYLLLFPIAFLSRLSSNKDPLNLKKNSGSTWKTVDRSFDQAYFEKTW